MSQVRMFALEYEGPNPMGALHTALGGSTIPAISLWQPWATLIGLREKRIETRGWYTDKRGWIAIHAAKTKRGMDELPGDCDGKHEDGWTYGYIGERDGGWMYQAIYRRDDARLVPLTNLDDYEEHPLSLGAIVAVARLVACEKMTPELIRLVPQPERSYGLYEPGRYMWMLEDAKMLPEPVPCRGSQGWFEWRVPLDLESLLQVAA